MKRRSSSLPLRLAAVVALGLSGAACTSIGEEFQRGYILDEGALASVKPGMSADQVLQTMGTPSTVSTVGNRNWYYISQTSRRNVQFLGETVTDQRVAAMQLLWAVMTYQMRKETTEQDVDMAGA